MDETVTQSLLAKLFGANHVRHGLKQLCDSPKVHLRPLTEDKLIPMPKCLINDKPAALKKVAQGGLAASSPSGPKGSKGPAKKKAGGNAKKCRPGEDPDAGDCVRANPLQVFTKKKGPQKQQQQTAKCAGGDENCGGSPKRGGPKRKLNSNAKRKKMVGGGGRTTTVATTTTEQDPGDLDTDEDASESDDLALADDPSLYYNHQFYMNRLSSSLQADEDESEFD